MVLPSVNQASSSRSRLFTSPYLPICNNPAAFLRTIWHSKIQKLADAYGAFIPEADKGSDRGVSCGVEGLKNQSAKELLGNR